MHNYIIYARKSTESDDRQILSIESQVEELKRYAIRNSLTIIEILYEAKSAKSPGRPMFNALMQKFHEDNKLHGILCWKVDRLARNPVDGGSVLWALEQEKIVEIRTPERIFTNRSDDQFMINLEFGMAKKYINDLSTNVKRGMRAKLEKGWLPHCAPIGYTNDRTNKTIVIDPDVAPAIQKLFELYATGNYSIKNIASVIQKMLPIEKQNKFKWWSHLSRILRNTFYYGMIKYKDTYYQGSHEPLVSAVLFNKVQKVLKSRGYMHEKPQKHDFPYTGLIVCDECGCAITAEEKQNRYGSEYVYYHCTRKKRGCGQKKYIRDYILEDQIVDVLEKIKLTEEDQSTCLKILEQQHGKEYYEGVKGENKSKKIQAVDEEQLAELLDMRLKKQVDDDLYNRKNKRV